MTLHNGDCLAVLKTLPANSVDSLVTDPPAGISFMGKEWDDDKGGRDAWVAWLTDVMRECMRVLKPGAHGLVWALPRTSHWTATALENAGFEIRDVVTHLFGTGFPKSMDISKAIDKAAGAEREILGPNPHARPSDGKYNAIMSGVKGHDPYITAPATEAAKQWCGWGTALKPASEHWILVRKPLSEKTVAANVLRHGTGGINVDGCRIESEPRPLIVNAGKPDPRGEGFAGKFGSSCEGITTQGRFPANLVLSDGAVDMLGENARFFYCAKASKKDKGEGNTHPTVKSTQLMEYLIRLVTPMGGTVLDPFLGSGSTGVAAARLKYQFIGIEADDAYFEIAANRLA